MEGELNVTERAKKAKMKRDEYAENVMKMDEDMRNKKKEENEEKQEEKRREK